MSEKALGRAFDVFGVFAQSRQPLSMSLVAARTGMPLASCARLLRALESLGLLSKLHDDQAAPGYYPTARLATLAEGIAEFNPWTRLLAEPLAALRDQSGESVVLGMRQRDTVRTLAVLESRQAIRYSVAVGTPRPMHAHSIGKALLGAMPLERRQEVARGLRYERFTQRTHGHARALLADVERGLRTGWHVNDAESQAGVVAIAVALKLPDEVYGLALVGPHDRVRPRLAQLGPMLQGAARKMQRLASRP